MSCRLWLNVWTCRSFTCPFTRRNLDRNPTAALISGFMVPRAQRVCIEKGLRRRPCAFVGCCLFFVACVCFFFHAFPPSPSPVTVALGLRACVEVEAGSFGPIARFSAGTLRLVLLVNTGVSLGAGVPCSRWRTLPCFTDLHHSDAPAAGERAFIPGAPPPPRSAPPPWRHQLLQQQRPANRRPRRRLTSPNMGGVAAVTSALWK